MPVSATPFSTCSPPAIDRRISTCLAAWDFLARSRSAWRWRSPTQRDCARRRRFDSHGARLPRPIANQKPRNLTVIVWDNGIDQITCKQRAATGGATDIVAVALGVGIAASEWVRDEAHFEKLLDRRFENGGPVLLAAKIDDAPGAGPDATRSGADPQPLHKGLGNKPRRRA